MPQCVLNVLAAPGGAPIRCRRKVWGEDLASGVCYACHPRGREQFIERVVHRILERSGGRASERDQRENKRRNRRIVDDT